MCSTPFGITELITAWACIIFFVESGCSTPFGITELITTGEWDVKDQKDECSTPFGITELITYYSPLQFTSGSCAQRLSASLS